jgi:uncharacterized protein
MGTAAAQVDAARWSTEERADKSLSEPQAAKDEQAALQIATSAEAPHTDCDTYTAHDQDPQRKSAGVSFDKINPSLAVPACESAVREYPTSMRLVFQLGRAYQKANNFAAALLQYQKAAGQEYAAAKNNIGLMYFNGQGVPKDWSRAVALYRKAADQGYAWAQYNLGEMYENGYSVPQDYAQAIALYRTAGDQGLAMAQAKLGYLYVSGRGVPKDYGQALTWFLKAADQGFAGAQFALGSMYENGMGVAKDTDQASTWYRKAAEQESKGR